MVKYDQGFGKVFAGSLRKAGQGGQNMSRHAFISGLRDALAGEIPDSVVEENIRFYNRYIDEELGKGRREEEVFAELGEPRLLAKTIAETWQSRDTSLGDGAGAYDGGNGRIYAGDGESGRHTESGTYVNINGRNVNVNKWYVKALPIVILLLIVFFVFWVIFSLLHLTVSILFSPVFWAILLVCMVIGFFSRRR